MKGITKNIINKYKNGYALFFKDKSAIPFANFIGMSVNNGFR